MKYFYEKLSEDDYKIGYKVKKSIYSKKIKNNKIEVFENPFLGRIFVLNGLIKLVQKYEFALSEMITHSIMFSHPKPEKVLVASDFDRGILKEILKYKNVNEVYFISDNKEAYEIAKKYFPELELKEVSKNEKIKIIFDNSLEYINNFQDYFDIIIIDSEKAEFKAKEFLKSANKALTKEGMLALVSGSLKDSFNIKAIKTIFRSEIVVRVPSITQIFSELGLILCSKKIDLSEISLRTLMTRFKQFKEAKDLKYYSPEMFLSSMVIPKFYKTK
ncbi:MAG: hypothetical protein PHG24_02730 [Candidatus Pacebacteria bacterium]|nr:hypothetical protein [Candidatus Paceibacterota bacterium]